MTDSTINNLKDSWIKGLKSIKNNPKSTPEQLKQADSLLKKVALMPVSIIK
ncbi:MAG: hypothetical protein P1U46_02465 [Patescibacteria group bacterium]|nr:hypothetical protein [Patescibacteria group bacterium]